MSGNSDYRLHSFFFPFSFFHFPCFKGFRVVMEILSHIPQAIDKNLENPTRESSPMDVDSDNTNENS